ncbi:MAG: HEAT repeat domain-containing protein [Acidobacteriaceae bacterium]|nr:HEAT repeat domain-containing protein [Acidobacteriaceae bacterium]
MKAVVVLLAASAVLAQTGPPSVSNARFETRAYSGNLDSQIRSTAPTWFGYAIKSTVHDNQNCCWNNGMPGNCSLENRPFSAPGAVSAVSGPIQLEGSDMLAVLFRVENNAVGKVRAYSLSCPLDAGGLPFVWLTGVPAAASISYLRGLITAAPSQRVADGAIFAISEHADPSALDALIATAKTDPAPHAREQALFWLTHKAGQRAASTITGAIENDPNTEVKKRAVFALSQLPSGEAVPKLIEVARSQRNPEVRKQAFFWLGQSKDPRALAFIEEVLTK